mmetsp:Transcript_12500/g.50046  ORF Transcript_12500/g.50046 Transcript_12500/m.50046 type:complete len:277 (+) Transcript_12500:2872-3702(+)
MHITVSQVAKATSNSGLGEPFAKLLYDLVEVLVWERKVILVHTAGPTHSLRNSLAQLPQLGSLRLVLCNNAICHQLLLHALLHEIHELFAVMVVVAAGRLYQSVEGEALGHRVDGAVLHRKVEGLVVHELKGRKDFPKSDLGVGQCLHHCLEAVEAKHYDVGRLRKGRTAQGNSCDNAKSALSADEEVPQVVSGVVLERRVHCVDQSSVSKYRLHAGDASLQRAVAQEAYPACVGGDVPANRAAALGPEVERDNVAVLLQLLRESLEHNSRLAAHH